jgi:hypothetical protein
VVQVPAPNHDFCEQKIQQLANELDYWRKKFLDLQAEQDRH